jgi:two-component sensor histidine kinase
VKNTLATVQSLARQTGRPGVAPEIAHERFQERLLALSRTHNLLNETRWEGASLRTVLETELAPYKTPSSRVHIEGPQIDLPARVAVVLGMAIHELTTNAVKYGALSSPLGRLEIDWAIQGRGGEAVLTVDWCEKGGPTPEMQSGPGFGTRLLRQTITRELAGTLDLRFERNGVCCTIKIPIRSIDEKAA